MDAVERDVYARLFEMGIAHEVFQHPPVHTIEDCRPAQERLLGRMPKNLFLTPRNKSAYYLMLVRPEAEFRTADISRQIGSSRLSFASADDSAQMLRTLPGAISPMGLLFDGGQRVRLLIDRALLCEERLLFHPCVNTATLAMAGRDFFEKYLPGVGRAPTFVDIHPEERI